MKEETTDSETGVLSLSHRLNQFVRNMNSVVSFPNRCNTWGDPKYPGNCDGRLFAGLVTRYGARRVADPMEGSGTTRHVVEWLNRKAGTQIEYWGNDLHAGFNLHAHDLPGEYDLVWIHPPYWNIVRYSDNPADLSSCEDYDAFVERLRVCLRRCAAALAPGVGSPSWLETSASKAGTFRWSATF